MTRNTDTVRLRRFCIHPAAALMALWGIGIVCMALYGMSGGFTTWYLPVWEMEFPMAVGVVLFLCVWFGFAFSWIWMALRPLQTVLLDGGEVRICLGPLVLRRMACENVRTVVLTDYDFRLSRGTYQSESRRLILSDKTAEELLDLVGGTVHAGSERNACIRNRLGKKRKLSRFYLEWTAKAELALRENLTTAVFIT